MATLESVIAALQAAPTMGNRADGLKVSGNLMIAICEYVMTGDESTDDKLRLVKLPDRAIVIPQLCSVRHEALGTTLDIKVGDEDKDADDDRYSAVIDASSAGQSSFSSAADGGLNPHIIEKPDGAWITALLNDVSSPTADKKVTFFIAYVTQT